MLFDAKESLIEDPILSHIRRRMLQVWVHSYIYYELDTNIISDIMWDKWSKELCELKEKYPDVFRKIKHSNIFRDFDGSTGYDIAKKATKNLIYKAHFLLKIHKNKI